MTDGGQFLLVQRGTGLSGVRRPSSAPPANIKLPVSSVARNRPASVGIQVHSPDLMFPQNCIIPFTVVRLTGDPQFNSPD